MKKAFQRTFTFYFGGIGKWELRYFRFLGHVGAFFPGFATRGRARIYRKAKRREQELFRSQLMERSLFQSPRFRGSPWQSGPKITFPFPVPKQPSSNEFNGV